MLVVNRFVVSEADGPGFAGRAKAAVAALRDRPGYVGARIGRAVDDPSAWVLATEWDDVGSYRRAMSSYEAKVHAHPLLGEAVADVSAFEVVYADRPGRAPVERASARAEDAATAGPGDRRT